jgi:hypothetical protein
MKTFQINERVSIECEWKKTRIAFKHVATLYVDGHEKETVKVCYQNRTWESYVYQTVMENLIYKTKSLTEDERETALKFVKDYKETGHFSGLLGVAAFGDILCSTKTDKNEWKKRMMKASLGDGVMFPDDWESLSEDEKERRLNAGLEALK